MKKTTTWAIIMMVLATLFNSTAQLLYKNAVNTSGLNILQLLSEGIIILGLLSYGISGVLMLAALKHGEASKLYPIYTLSFVWITLGAILWFGETLSILASVGILAVITGIILINLEGKK